MQRDRADIERGLKTKGFTLETGDHRYFVYHTASGSLTDVWTKTSRGSHYKSLGPFHLGEMARQCRLKKNQFLDLIDCPLSRSAYEKILAEAGVDLGAPPTSATPSRPHR